MFSILRTRLPADEATVRASLAKYLTELEAHKKTVGVAAPWPEFDLLRDIVASGGDFLVVEDPDLEAREMTPAQQYEQAIRAIEVKRDNALLAGVLWEGRMWHTDESFQVQVTGILTAFREGVLPADATVNVRAIDNTMHQLTRAQLLELAGLTLQKVQTVYGLSWAEKDQVIAPAPAAVSAAV